MNRLLLDDEVDEIVGYLLEARFASSSHRGLFTVGIAPALSGTWPIFPEPALQIRSDLNEMGRVRPASETGGHPLPTWLENAARLFAPRLESERFREIATSVRQRLKPIVSRLAERRRIADDGAAPHHSATMGSGSPFTLYRPLGSRQLALRELTVSLTLEGDLLVVGWSANGLVALAEPRRIPFPDEYVIDRTRLFGLLFPGPGDQGCDPAPVLRALGVATDPRACTLRLRIRTDDDRLASLPWCDLAYEGERLIGVELGWTVEVVSRTAVPSDVRLFTEPIIIVYDSGLEAGELREVLAMRRPSGEPRVRVVEANSSTALLDCLADAPRAVLVTRLADPGAASTLGRLLQSGVAREGAPFAVCAIGDPCLVAPLHLLDMVPLLVRFTRSDIAIEWLSRVIDDGVDPTVAACEPSLGPVHRPLSHATPVRTHPGPRAIRVLSAYRRWHSKPAYREERPGPASMLDRIAQRNVVLAKAEAMYKGTHRHLQVFVASGLAQHRIDLLSVHVRQYIQLRMTTTHLRALQLPLPRAQGQRSEPVMSDLTSALAVALNEPDVVKIRDVARCLVDPVPNGSRALVWLDWGAYGVPDTVARTVAQTTSLKKGELRQWLSWHIMLADELKGRGVRAVAFISCQTPDWHALAAELDAWALKTDLTSVEFTMLPPLRHVAVNDLREYLNDRDISRVDGSLVGPLTRAIAGRYPDGDFDGIVQTLGRGHEIGWSALLGELSGHQHERADDQEEFR